jgi:hypothetical protein
MIVPEMFNGVGFGATIALREKNHFATVGGGEFGFGSFSDDLKFSFLPIVNGFAGDVVGRLSADENGKIMTGTQGYCGFVGIDVETKDTLDTIPSVSLEYEGKPTVWRTVLTELPGRIIIVNLSSANENAPVYMLYDLKGKKELYIPDSSAPQAVNFYPFSKTKYLIETGRRKSEWYFADLSIQGFVNLQGNALTAALNKNGFRSFDWNHSRCFNVVNRMLVGWVDVGDKNLCTVVHWDSTFENIKIEPLTFQCPATYSFSNWHWTFSLDGKWLLTTAREKKYTGLGDNQLVFYHVDPKYPQGISPPVFAGKIGDEVKGCFVDHTKLGMVFLDVQTGHNAVLVYKMSDMLPIIAKKLAQN